MKRTVLVVEHDAQRAQRIEQLLAPHELACVSYTSWSEVEGHLDTLSPTVAILDLQTLGGVEEASLVDIQLMTLGLPALLLHGDIDDWELSLLEIQSDFGQILPWSAADTAILSALEALYPGLTHANPEAESFQNFDSLVTQALELRIAAPIPSLSSGTLQSTPVPRLLYFLALQQRTGVLELTHEHGATSATVPFSDGRLMQSPDHTQPDALQKAFSWDRGTFRFTWTDDPGGQVVAFLPFIHESIALAISINDITRRLAKHEHSYPAFTTLFLGRYPNLSRLGVVADVGHACTGEHSLSELFAAHHDDLDAFAHAFAFLLYTDGVTLLEQPGRAPVGLTYRLQDRLEDVSAVTAPQEVLAGEANTSENTGFSRDDEGTRYQIATLSDQQRAVLEQYEDLQRRLIESDPYATFNLVEGCGRDAVREAFDATSALLPELPDNFPAPLRVTATLVVESLRDTCLLIMANESTDAPADGIGAESARRASAVPYTLEETLQQLTFSAHAAADADVTASGFQREPTVRRPKDPDLARAADEAQSPERQFELGQRGLKARDYALARRAFESAHAHAPKNGLYLAYLGWATYLEDPKSPREARVMLKRALTLDGGREMASFVLGTISLQRGRLDDASEYFHTVLELRPNNREALRALKMIELRQKGG